VKIEGPKKICSTGKDTGSPGKMLRLASRCGRASLRRRGDAQFTSITRKNGTCAESAVRGIAGITRTRDRIAPKCPSRKQVREINAAKVPNRFGRNEPDSGENHQCLTKRRIEGQEGGKTKKSGRLWGRAKKKRSGLRKKKGNEGQ